VYILNVTKNSPEAFTREKRERTEQWKILASQYNAVFLLEQEGSRKPAQVIIDMAKQYHITQILLGQSARTRWEKIRKGSIVYTIMRKTENIDIHIVSDGRF
jgi:two-component system sensor histidine kinase KdpD